MAEQETAAPELVAAEVPEVCIPGRPLWGRRDRVIDKLTPPIGSRCGGR